MACQGMRQALLAPFLDFCPLHYIGDNGNWLLQLLAGHGADRIPLRQPMLNALPIIPAQPGITAEEDCSLALLDASATRRSQSSSAAVRLIIAFWFSDCHDVMPY